MTKEFDVINLVKLQAIDNIINKKLAELKRISKNEELQKAEDDFLKSKEVLEKVQNAYNDIESKRKALEDKVELNGDKIKSIQEKLFSGTIGTSKELLNYQEEMKSLEAANEKMEDEAIELMMKLEDVEGPLKDAKNRNKDRENKVIEVKKKMEEKTKDLKKEIEKFKEKKEGVLKLIPDEYIAKYNKVKEKREGIAVSVLKDNFCSVCNMEISSKDADRINDINKIYKCPLCGRMAIIYREEIDDIKKELAE